MVGLGCEVLQSDEVAADMSSLDTPIRELSIQGAGGTDECITEGIQHVEELVEIAETTNQTTADLGDLTLGIVSSDLRGSTIDNADPLIGAVSEAVVEAGGRVIVAGIERFTAHPEAALAATSSTAEEPLESILANWRNRPAKMTRVRSDAESYEFGDLAALWGNQPLDAAVSYGESPAIDSGVAVLDAPSQFEEAATGLAAAGAQVVLHATADGIPTGHPLVPVIKVSGDQQTVEALPSDIDLDATRADPSEATDLLRAVAGGDQSAAESHGLTEFAITRVGPSM